MIVVLECSRAGPRGTESGPAVAGQEDSEVHEEALGGHGRVSSARHQDELGSNSNCVGVGVHIEARAGSKGRTTERALQLSAFIAFTEDPIEFPASQEGSRPSARLVLGDPMPFLDF